MEVEHSSFPKIKKKVQLSPISCPKKYFSPPHHFYPVVLFLLLRCLLGSSRKFFHRKRKAAWQTNVLTPAFRRPERSGYHTGSREIVRSLWITEDVFLDCVRLQKNVILTLFIYFVIKCFTLKSYRANIVIRTSNLWPCRVCPPTGILSILRHVKHARVWGQNILGLFTNIT